MNVFFIQFNRKTNSGRFAWILFETHYSSMLDLTDAINRGDMVYGFELLTRPGEDQGEREVFNARETAFRLEDIRRIGLPDWKLVRYED